MTHSHRIPKALVVWALLFSLCAAGASVVGAAQSAAGDPMRIIPADAMFCVRINKLSAALGQMDQFLTGIFPPGVSLPVRSQMGKFLGAPEPVGVDMAGDIVVFWPLPGGEKPDSKRVGVLVPVSDFQQFLTNPNVVKPDAQGILKLNIEGKPSVAGIRMGNYLLLARAADQQALTEAKSWTTGAGTASLAQRLSPEELKRATGSPAWIYANIQIVAKVHGPALQQKIKEAQATFQKMQTQGQPLPFQPQGMLDMYTSLLNTLLQETQFVSVALDPSATAIRLASVVAALPNTEMAKTLSADSAQPQQPNLLGYLDNGAAMNAVLNLGPAPFKAVMLMNADLLTTMLGAAPKEEVAKVRQLMTDSVDALGGSLAMSMSANPASKPPLEFKYVATLKDKQKFYQVLEQSSKMMTEGALADFYKKLGIQMRFDVKRNVETYKDVPIDAIHLTMQATDANRPDAQAMKKMFGEGFDLRLATVNNLLVYTMGANPEQKIHALIDQAKAGGPTQTASEVQAAMNLLPDARKAEVFGTYNILRAMQLGMAFAPMPVPAMDVSSQSGGIAFSGDLGDGKLVTNVAIPKQHALEVMGAIMRMQQQMQKQPGQPGAQPPSGPGKPARKPGET